MSVLVLPLIILASGLLSAATAERPNIIFIEVDDLTYTYTPTWGAKASLTPNLDRLAKSGFVFDNAMAQGMMCGPSRNCLISGRYPHQLGFYENGQLRKLPADSWLLPKELQAAGYTTAWVGKSHLKPFFADRKEKNEDSNFYKFFGFDFSLHTMGRALVGDNDSEGKAGGPNAYMDHLEKSGLTAQYRADADAGRNSTLPEDDYLDGWFTKNAIDYLTSYKSPKPLFLWMNYSVPHGPYDVPDSFHEPFSNAPVPGLSKAENFTHPASLIERTKSYRSEQEAIKDQRGFLSNIHYLDRQLGRLMESLENKKMLDNSWIVFFSDQGVMIGAQGLTHKSTLFRQVTQPSLIIRPPGGVAGPKRIEAPVELLDLLPTTLEIAGDRKAPAGFSLLPLFRGEKGERKFAFAEIEDWVAVTDGNYRLINSVKDEQPLLFDETKDPENLCNIADKNPAVVKSLQQAIEDWSQSTGPRLAPKSL